MQVSNGDESLWTPPSASDCWEDTVSVAVDVDNLITMRRLEWDGQLVEYAIIHSRKDSEGNWVEMTCIDTMHHGSVHRHDGPHNLEEPKIIRAITTQADVQESFKPSYDEVYDSYLESKKGQRL
jgi:hypothetical protein